MTVVRSGNLEAAMSNTTPTPDANGPATPGPTGTDYTHNRGHRVVLHSDGSQSSETIGVVRGSSEDVARGESPFSDVRDAQGYPVHISEAQPDSVVTVPGVGPMSLRSALAAGFATQRPDGSYASGNGDAPEVDQGAEADQQETPAELQGEAFEDVEVEGVAQTRRQGPLRPNVLSRQDTQDPRPADGSAAASTAGTRAKCCAAACQLATRRLLQCDGSQECGDSSCLACARHDVPLVSPPSSIGRANGHRKFKRYRGHLALAIAALGTGPSRL